MAGPMVLPPGEPEAGPWTAIRIDRLVELLLAGADAVRDRPWVVAVDGRGGAGKSTLVERVRPHLAPAAVVHTDDLAWHEPLFGWGHLLADDVLRPLRAGRGVSFRPPAWGPHDRSGKVEVPAGLGVVLIEGNGANQRRFAHLIDRTVWVQADHQLAEERGIERDIAHGVNGDAGQSRQFWHDWMAHELPFFADEQPWRRADVIVAGTPVLALAHDEVAWARGPIGIETQSHRLTGR